MVNLVFDFKDSLSRVRHLSLRNFDKPVSPIQAQNLADLLVETNLFTRDGADLYATVMGARTVETIETPVFTNTPISNS